MSTHLTTLGLQYLIHESEIYYENEDFPGRAVADLQRLRARIINNLNHNPNPNPNPYILKNIIVKEPEKPIDNKAYTIDMYGSENNRNKCFCQMCQKLIDKKYIERNDVQKQPKYGWDQMYLSLCVMCSKDYILLRNNDNVWKKFIESILEADVEDEEIVKIPIGDKEIAFTATHLAEIQAILEVEVNNKKGI